jgi:hypothetical protein
MSRLPRPQFPRTTKPPLPSAIARIGWNPQENTKAFVFIGQEIMIANEMARVVRYIIHTGVEKMGRLIGPVQTIKDNFQTFSN